MKSVFAKEKLLRSLAFAGLAALACRSYAADLSLPVTGNLLGSVADSSGVPQMGASVQLLNKYDRIIAKTLTMADGRFAFAALPADLYSIRVSLTSFLPAAKDRIMVKAGLDSVLDIHLATLFSSVELSYRAPSAAMTDEWRWVLRSSPATRLITRILPQETSSSDSPQPRVFTGTHAMLTVSGGDSGLIDSDSTQGGDLGTGFILSTNVLGKNQLELGGTVGQEGPLGMALCAIYSRSDSAGIAEYPEVTFTVSQLGLSGGAPGNTAVSAGNPPQVRAMSLSVYDVADPSDNVHFEYGMTAEAVDYLQNTSRLSPFARLTIDLNALGKLISAYSDGGRPDQLLAHSVDGVTEEGIQTQDMGDAVNTLSRLPQISDHNGVLKLQRTQNYEIGYRKNLGSRTIAVSGFSERVSNGRLNLAGNLSSLPSDDLLSDGVSNTSIYGIGAYSRTGYLASMAQRIGDSLTLTFAYGRMGAFSAENGALITAGHFLSESDHNVASANLRVHAPVTHTLIHANYGWMDPGAFTPAHSFVTQPASVAPGLNIYIRQPLPSLFGMPGRLEITADLRNLLATGYVPLDTSSEGRALLVVQNPRSIRGGLNFIF